MSTKTVSTTYEIERQYEDQIAKLRDENCALKWAIETRVNMETMFSRYNDDTISKSIDAGLTGVSDTHNVWQAIHALLRQHIRIEHDAARAPDLSNESLRYNIGRESALEDFQNILYRRWAAANKPGKSS